MRGSLRAEDERERSLEALEDAGTSRRCDAAPQSERFRFYLKSIQAAQIRSAGEE